MPGAAALPRCAAKDVPNARSSSMSYQSTWPRPASAPRPFVIACRLRGARVLDTVAVERVAAPFLRQELVVSREQLRVVPVVADERRGEPLRDRQLRSECGSQLEADRSRAAPATEDSLEQRLSRLEQGLATIKQLMVEERKRELERLPAEK